MSSVETITVDEAGAVISAGEAKAVEARQPMNLSVVDAGGTLVTHPRMDGAWNGSVDISMIEASTAWALGLPTADLADQAAPGEQFRGINGSSNRRVAHAAAAASS